MNVGELAAYLTLDDTQFQSKLTGAKGGLSGLGNLAKGAGQVVASSLTAGTAAATTMGVKLVQAGVSYNVLQQNSRAALTTLLGSQTAVNAQMEKLNELASRSPFGKNLFIEAQQQLISFGMAAEKVVPTLDAVQNAVAATGGSGQQLSEITFVLAQIQAAGKITGQDLMQLGQRGIDAATLMGNSLGKSGAEIRKDITAGTLDAGTAIDALVQGMTAKFGGATDLIKQQWSGATDRIKAAWRDTGSIIAEPFIDPNGGGQAVVWANLVADTMRSVQTHVTAAMRVVDKSAGPVFDMITKGLQESNAAVKGFDITRVLQQVETLGKYTPLVSGASTALLALGTAPVPGLGKLASGMTPVLLGISALVAASPELRGVGTAFTDALAPAVPQLQEAGKGAADLAMQVISALAPGLTKAAAGAGKFVGDMAPLVPMMVDAAGAAVPLVSAVADLAGWFANLPTPLLAAAAAVVAFHGPLGSVKTGILGLGDPLKSFGSSVGSTLSGAKAAVDLFSEGWANARANGVPNMKAIAQTAGEVGSAMTGGKSLVAGFGSAIMGILSPANLVGAGLTVLTGIVAMYAAKKAEAKKKTDEFQAALDQETGALTANNRAQIAKNLQDDDRLAAYEKLGGASQDYVGALMGEQDALDRYNAVIDAASGKRHTLWEAGSALNEQGMHTSATWQQQQDEARQLGVEIQTVTDGYDEQKGIIDTTTTAQQEQIRASQEATQAAKDQKAALDAVYDAMQKQAAANGDLVSAQYAAADATEKGNQLLADGTTVTRDAAGGIDNYAESTRKLREQALDMAHAYNDQSKAAADAGKSQADLDGITQGNYDSFMKFAEAAGYSADEAKALANEVGLIPSRKSVVVDMTADTTAAETDVKALLDEVADSKGNITIDARNDPAAQKLAESLGLVNDGEGAYSINAKDDEALAVLFASLGLVNTSTGTITLDGNNEKSNEKLQQALALANGSTGTMTLDGNPGQWNDKVTEALRRANNSVGVMTLDGNPYPANAKLSDFMNRARQTTGTMGINAEDRGAMGTARGIANSISALDAFIKVHAVRVPSSIARPEADGGVLNFYKNGGIFDPRVVKTFANGGHENHVAQMAPAGAWRVWAEDETLGESYIPHAPSKRARSEQIMGQTANILGGMYIPARALRRADGAVDGPTPAAPTRSSNSQFPQRVRLVIRDREFVAFLEEVSESAAIDVVNSRR